MKIRCVYLAAGNSRRFGKNKLFHMVGQNPMYLHLLDRLAAVAERHKELEIVVVSQYEELLQEAVGEGPGPVCDPSVEKERRALLAGSGRLYPVYSPQSREGVSHSIRAGILAGMPESSPISGMCRQEAGREPDVYVFFVADQPWLSERTVEAFLEFMKKVSGEDRESHPIGCVSCLGEPGNPVWFSEFYKDELLALSGDRGGKRVMKAHMDQVHFFEVRKRENFGMWIPWRTRLAGNPGTSMEKRKTNY